MSKNNIRAVSPVIVAIIIVVIIVVAGVGAYVATRHTTSPSTTPTPTPTSTSKTSTSSPTPTATHATTSTDITTATSYEFNLTEYASNGTLVDTGFYAADNLGTSNVQYLWIAQIPSQGTIEEIVNGETQQAWAVANGQVTDLSTAYPTELTTIEATAGVWVNMLKGWGGSGSFTYTVPSGQPNAGYKAEFTNIHLNISLPATYFQAPS